MTTDVLYVTYRRDAEWFRHSSKVIERNLSGYRQMVVVAPQQDRAIFDPIAATLRTCRMVYIPDWPGAGYYWQQFVKMSADQYSDADLIAHIDSDVFINVPVTVDSFMSGARPAWLWTYYSDLGSTPMPWKKPTERATGWKCPIEFMQGFPFFIHRSTYAVCRERIRQVSGRTCEQYIREIAPTGPAAFSEFNAMGRIAWERQHDLYHWIDRNRELWPDGYYHSVHFWSHAPVAAHLPAIQQMLTGTTEHQIRVTNRGIWVLTNDTHISKWVEQQHRLDFDTPVTSQLCLHIHRGDTVVDVGAFIGDHTIAYARACEGGKVIAFEPNPTAYECLRRNMADFPHVQCENSGLSDFVGEMDIARDVNAGASHLVPGTGIRVSPLDVWGLSRLNFLKIDAEGLELRILHGAAQTISSCRPVIWIEINSSALARAGTTPEAVRDWFLAHNYKISEWFDGPQFDILCLP